MDIITAPVRRPKRPEPSNEALKETLTGYAKLNKSVKEQLQLLHEDLGYRIGERKLYQLRKSLNIPSARRSAKTLAPEVQVQAIIDATAEDRLGIHGTNRVRDRLIRSGLPLPRGVIRQVRSQLDPDGGSRRFPGSKRKIHRGTLQSDGPLREISADGHEKLNSQALGMGPVALNIYAFRDKWTGAVLLCRVVPNDRCRETIAHLYLDMVAVYGVVPVQLTTDKGGETAIMQDFHRRLRKVASTLSHRRCSYLDREGYAPDLTEEAYPSCVALKSTQNITIESWWKHLGQATTWNFKRFLLDGKQNNIYNAASPLHINLFNWLWPEILQRVLDKTVKEWNEHCTRRQAEKAMPSGVSPNELWEHPERYGKIRCGIDIQDAGDVTQQLRSELALNRDQVFSWVPNEFGEAAYAAYEAIGQPELTMMNGWDIYTSLLPLLQGFDFEFE